jgi:hypothetical protein
MCSCQNSTGTWLVTMVDARSCRSLNDLHQIASLFRRQRRDGLVIQDQQLHPCQALQHARIPAVAAGDAECLQQPRHTLIQRGPIIAAGTVPECTGQPVLARAGRPSDEQILMAFDPFAAGQLLKQGAIETTGGAVIDIFLPTSG